MVRGGLRCGDLAPFAATSLAIVSPNLFVNSERYELNSLVSRNEETMMQRVVVRNSQVQIPTMSKLFAGLALAAAGFFAAQGIVPMIPAGTDGAEELPLIMASFGLMFGWRVVGVRPGRRWVDACNDGLRGAIYLLAATFAFLGTIQMFKLAVRMRYDDVLSAITDVAGQGIGIGMASLSLQPILTLGIGAMLAGVLSEYGHRRFGR